MSQNNHLSHLPTSELRKFVEHHQDKIIAGSAIIRDYELYIQAQWELALRLEHKISNPEPQRAGPASQVNF